MGELKIEGVFAAGVVMAKPDIPRVSFCTAARGDLDTGRVVVVLCDRELMCLFLGVAIGRRDVAGGGEKSWSGFPEGLGTEKEKDDISKDYKQERVGFYRDVMRALGQVFPLGTSVRPVFVDR